MNTKRLYKSNKDKRLAGVCGGIAEYFNIDSTLVRLGFLFSMLVFGTGLLFYIIAAVIIPERPEGLSYEDENYETTSSEIDNRYDFDQSRYNNYDTRDQQYNTHEYNDYSYDPDRKLYRSTSNRVLAGVCGGIGEYFKIDPTIIRVVVLLLAFAYGGGIIAYLIAWALIPEKIH